MKHQHRNTGFTLVEALVALTILTIGLVPAFIQASRAVTLSISVRNSLIATHLAQEGAEITRSLRDADWFASRPFGQSLSGCVDGCQVQWDSQVVSPIIIVGNSPLQLDPASGLYQYATGPVTPFSRVVTVTSVSGHELKMVVSVTWEERTGPKEFTIEYHLYDWLQ